ncbi:hypothetical protein LguiA_022418 [Lonicera macranthoides]
MHLAPNWYQRYVHITPSEISLLSTYHLAPSEQQPEGLRKANLIGPYDPTELLSDLVEDVSLATFVARFKNRGMARKRPMTASERERKSKKHCAVTAAKKHEKTKKPVTPTPPEKKATTTEKAQEHDPNATPSGNTRALAKDKENTSATKRRKN